MTKAMTSRTKKDRLPPLAGRDENGYFIQPMAEEIIQCVEARGGRVWLDRYRLMAKLPKKNLKQLKMVLKKCRASVYQYLLQREPKIPIAVACRCGEKPYAHLTHNRPAVRGPVAHVKATDLTQLRDALVLVQQEGRDRGMRELVERLEQVSLKLEITGD